MKLAKALKLKNKLAGDVSHLKGLLTEQNVRSTKQPFDYDAKKVLADLRAKLDELVKVKAAIAAANAEIYDKIFRRAEMKGLIAALNSLNTRTGVFVEGEGYRGTSAVEVEYVAQIRKAEADQLVVELQAEVEALQEALDEFNHTRTVNL